MLMMLTLTGHTYGVISPEGMAVSRKKTEGPFFEVPRSAVWIREEDSSFPGHWGVLPQVQTRDLVPLPAEFGDGSSTLRHWLLKNIREDCATESKKQNLRERVPEL